jgi:hypothetical protein
MPVYFIGQEEKACSPIKIGVAKNISVRKRNLQTGNLSDLRLLGWIEVADAFRLERHLHQHFEAIHVRGEWFAIKPADILPILISTGRDGFVAKNADAFQIVGYDRDAIPEYLGLWEWADLEMDQFSNADMDAAPTAKGCFLFPIQTSRPLPRQNRSATHHQSACR